MDDFWINIAFLGVTGFIAWHALRGVGRPSRLSKMGPETEKPDAETLSQHKEDSTTRAADAVRLLFGCIAALFFMLVLFRDVLGINPFSG